MKIRSLDRADAALFQALRLRGLIECPSAFASTYEEESELSLEDVGERLSRTKDRFVFGAFEGPRLVGVLGLVREHKAKLAHKAFLWGMYVDPEYRNRGIAGKLVRQALRHARELPGVRQVYLGVNAANAPAQKLYTSKGFKEFGREPGFMLVDGVLHDEVCMVCILGDV